MSSFATMYKASVFILILRFGYLSSLIGEEDHDVTTATPMLIKHLDYNDICKFQPNGFDCGKRGRKLFRYYYDMKLGACKAVTVGDCQDNANVFWDMKSCSENCRELGEHLVSANLTSNIYCRLQPDFGQCNNYVPLWYFDVTSKACKGFSYSGCGGNMNKFGNAHDCTTVCGPAVTYEKIVA